MFQVCLDTSDRGKVSNHGVFWVYLREVCSDHGVFWVLGVRYLWYVLGDEYLRQV